LALYRQAADGFGRRQPVSFVLKTCFRAARAPKFLRREAVSKYLRASLDDARGDEVTIVKLSKTLYGGLLVGSLAWLAGCSGKASNAPYTPDPAVANFPKMGRAVANSPEVKIAALKTSQQKASFFQDLANDSTFDPKLHKDMLEKYSKDSDADVAAGAQALLDRAQ
jgi:hypothetical protein